MRDNSESAMLSMPSFLELRHRLLHLWASLERDPNNVIKKGRPHGNRHGKIEEQIKHFVAHNLRKRCIKKNFEGIHDRFQKI